MARLTELPPEILKLIVDNITEFGNYSIILPLAQTYNKAIYAACLGILQHRQLCLARHRTICEKFQEDPQFDWAFGFEMLCLDFLPYDGTLSWLDDLVQDANDPPVSDESFQEVINGLISAAASVDCELPNAFIQFYQKIKNYRPFFTLLDECEHEPSRVLHKTTTKNGSSGYLLRFMCNIHPGEGEYCLFLDPGPRKAYAVVFCINLCSGWYDCNESGKPGYLIDDSCLGHSDMCEEQYGLLATNFEAWLAGFMFAYEATDHVPDLAAWDRKYPPESLRGSRFQQFIAANPDFSY